MKKLFIILLVLVCAFLSVGLKVYIGTDHWVTWDAISYSGDGIVSYLVFMESEENPGFNTLITEVSDPPVYMGAYLPDNKWQHKVGVQTKIVDDQGEHISVRINWSDVEEVVGETPTPFGFLPNVPVVTSLEIYEAPPPTP